MKKLVIIAMAAVFALSLGAGMVAAAKPDPTTWICIKERCDYTHERVLLKCFRPSDNKEFLVWSYDRFAQFCL